MSPFSVRNRTLSRTGQASAVRGGTQSGGTTGSQNAKRKSGRRKRAAQSYLQASRRGKRFATSGAINDAPVGGDGLLEDRIAQGPLGQKINRPSKKLFERFRPSL